MTDYAICFDFPEQDDPWFAAQLRGGLGFTQSLVGALMFDSEADADRVLADRYPVEARSFCCRGRQVKWLHNDPGAIYTRMRLHRIKNARMAWAIRQARKFATWFFTRPNRRAW